MNDPDSGDSPDVWTDERLAAHGVRAELKLRGHGTGLVSYADDKRTAQRRFVTRCPLPSCGAAINPEWNPDLERFVFTCTSTRHGREPCPYTKSLGRRRYLELLEQMTDADGRPIPGRTVTLPP